MNDPSPALNSERQPGTQEVIEQEFAVPALDSPMANRTLDVREVNDMTCISTQSLQYVVTARALLHRQSVLIAPKRRRLLAHRRPPSRHGTSP